MRAVTGTEEYYERRVAEYDQVYAKAERQPDLRALRSRVSEWLAGRRVLEVAAGTGWWTDAFADSAAEVVATDVNPATLVAAAARRSWPPKTRFVEADAFALEEVDGSFDAAFVGFFWSHVPLDVLDPFLGRLVRRLEPGALRVVIDNRFVAGSSHPIARCDERGNTYQQRRLADATCWEVLKNFPTPPQLCARLRRVADRVEIEELEYFWTARCRTAPDGPESPEPGCTESRHPDEPASP